MPSERWGKPLISPGAGPRMFPGALFDEYCTYDSVHRSECLVELLGMPAACGGKRRPPPPPPPPTIRASCPARSPALSPLDRTTCSATLAARYTLLPPGSMAPSTATDSLPMRSRSNSASSRSRPVGMGSTRPVTRPMPSTRCARSSKASRPLVASLWRNSSSVRRRFRFSSIREPTTSGTGC